MLVKGIKYEINTLGSKDIRNYVSYLALKQRVSSSTQNQTGNAGYVECAEKPAG